MIQIDLCSKNKQQKIQATGNDDAIHLSGWAAFKLKDMLQSEDHFLNYCRYALALGLKLRVCSSLKRAKQKNPYKNPMIQRKPLQFEAPSLKETREWDAVAFLLQPLRFSVGYTCILCLDGGPVFLRFRTSQDLFSTSRDSHTSFGGDRPHLWVVSFTKWSLFFRRVKHPMMKTKTPPLFTKFELFQK